MTNYPNGLSSQGVPLFGGVQDISGKTYFVDGNSGNDGNDGSTWAKAMKTCAVAFAASHADIADGAQKHWARRNTVYIAGDTFTENLVAFPQKTDVIGVGSDDGFSMACIEGNHAPVNASLGTRFYNVRFLTKTAVVIVTLASTSSGTQFINCLFDATGSAATATRGILATASPYLKVIGCQFQGAFVTSYITFGTGQAMGTVIQDNIMVQSAAGGILTGAGTTASYMGVIRGNLVQAVGVAIDTQATSVFVVADNTFISTAALGSGSFVCDLTFAANNVITGNDISRSLPFITIA